MIRKYIENANFEETGFSYTMSLISGKHKMVILYCLPHWLQDCNSKGGEVTVY